MPQAIVDLEDLRRFAAVLKVTTNQMGDSKNGIASKFVELQTYWRDSKQAKFARDFNEMMARLKSFLDESEKHIEFLRRKAELGDPYF